MKFILSIPPSINQTYGTSRSGKIPFYKKRPVRDWEWTAGWEVKRQRVGRKEPLLGNVSMRVIFSYSRDRDIDNGLKVLLDLFQKQRVYLNDKQIVLLTVVKYQNIKVPMVEVEIDEL
jgi:Holliday junction resolvase RusA-like endonuclease